MIPPRVKTPPECSIFPSVRLVARAMKKDNVLSVNCPEFARLSQKGRIGMSVRGLASERPRTPGKPSWRTPLDKRLTATAKLIYFRCGIDGNGTPKSCLETLKGPMLTSSVTTRPSASPEPYSITLFVVPRPVGEKVDEAEELNN